MKITTREQAIAVLALADTVSRQVDAVNREWERSDDDSHYNKLDQHLCTLSDVAADLRAAAQRALGGAV